MAKLLTRTPKPNRGNSLSSQWQIDSPDDALFLIDAIDNFEEKTIINWLQVQGVAQAHTARIDRYNSKLAEVITQYAADTWLQPIRIVWLPKPKKQGRFAFLRNHLFNWAQHPGWIGRRWLARRQSPRMDISCGQGARVEQVRTRFSETWAAEDTANEEFAAFVRRQALIVLDREERVKRGARYKIPRKITRDVFASPWFRQQLADIQAENPASSIEQLRVEAEKYLDEMATTQTPATIDLMMAVGRAMYQSTHEAKIDVVEDQLEKIKALIAERPVAFLVTHKSMLDILALMYVLFQNNLPMPLTFGGINLKTVGIGSLARRAGIIFLRRSFHDLPVYKATFRRYVDYLTEKRFTLAWALEGARSRTGKLLPPRLGLIRYVVDSILRTRLFDFTFVPVSVAFDQITEVDDYVIEQRGQEKKAEGASWVIRFMRAKLPHGRIFLRFGDPLDIRKIVSEDELRVGLSESQVQSLVQKLAFEVAVRMNAATPVTGTSLITFILLASGQRAMTFTDIQLLTRSGLSLVRARNLELVGPTNLTNKAVLTETLKALQTTGVIKEYSEGLQPLYGIPEGAHLKASYYRNTIIHFFVVDALIELAMLSAWQYKDLAIEHFWTRVLELRNLFKFEFYFSPSEEFSQEVAGQITDRFPSWEEALTGGHETTLACLANAKPLLAHGVLRSFVDAYQVVAHHLTSYAEEPVLDEKPFLEECLKLGRQWRLQGRLFSEESVSKSLYSTAFNVAKHRNLVENDPSSDQDGEGQEVELPNSSLLEKRTALVSEKRTAFAQELNALSKLLDEELRLITTRQFVS